MRDTTPAKVEGGHSTESRRVPGTLHALSCSCGKGVLLLTLAFPVFVLLCLGILLFPAGGRDDSYISYWSIYSLSEFGEILNYNGERVEQSSGLLQTLLASLLRALSAGKLEPSTSGRLITIFFGVLAIPFTFFLCNKIATPRLAFLASLLVSSNCYFTYWTFGGLETSLLAFGLLWTVLAWDQFLRQPSLSIFAVLNSAFASVFLILARPEATIVLIALLISMFGWMAIRHFVYARAEYRSWTLSLTVALQNCPFAPARQAIVRIKEGVTLRRTFQLAAIGLIAVGILFAWRSLYFGRLFPLPVYAKVSVLSWARLEGGWQYYVNSLLNEKLNFLLGLLCLGGLSRMVVWDWRSSEFKPSVILSAFLTMIYGGFVMFNPDWMEAGRFFAMFMPLLMIACVLGLDGIARNRVLFAGLGIAIFCGQIKDNLDLSRESSSGLAIFQERPSPTGNHLEKLPLFDRWSPPCLRDSLVSVELNDLVEELSTCRKEKVTIASIIGGYLPYQLAKDQYQRFRFLDIAGLTDPTVLDCPAFQSVKRNHSGLQLSTQEFVEMLPLAKQECGIPNPDIIYANEQAESNLKQKLEDSGYETVYILRGLPLKSSAPEPFKFTTYIFVRSEILKSCNIKPGFTEVQLQVSAAHDESIVTFHEKTKRQLSKFKLAN